MASRFKRMLGVLASAVAAAWTPASEASLAGWWSYLDLADGAVASWVSRDSTAQALVQGTGANQPIKSSSGVVFDGVNDTLTRPQFSGAFVSGQVLPDIPNAQPGVGFTCTGAEAAPDGTIWVAYHGLANSSDVTWYTALVHLSADGSTLLDYISLYDKISGIQSVQDIGFDTSDNTLWFTDVTHQKLQHITTTGTVLGDGIQLAYSPNGCSYDATRDALWVNRDSGATSPDIIECISCSTGTVLITQSVTLLNRDSMSYDNSTKMLMISAGANGFDGTVSIYNCASGVICLAGTMLLPGFNAAEGIVWNGTTLRGFNDAYFHRDSTPSPTPNLNRMLTYKVIPLASNVVQIWGVFQETAATTGTDALMTIGDPVTAGSANVGVAVFTQSNTQYGVYSQTGGATNTTQDILAATTVPSLLSKHIVCAIIDQTNDLITLRVNGTQVSTQSAIKILGGFSPLGVLRLASSITSDGSGRYCSVAAFEWGITFGAGDFQRMEGYLAWTNGLQGLLPAGHAYKSAPP